MSYIILYIVVSLLICFVLSFLLIKGFILLWNNLKSQNINLRFTTKNALTIFIPVTFVFWIGITLFILANLEMH